MSTAQREHPEIDVGADDGGDLKQVSGVLVQHAHPLPHNVHHRRRQIPPMHRKTVCRVIVGKQSREFSDEKRVAGSPEMDAAGNGGLQDEPVFAVDEFDQFVGGEWIEPDPTVPRQPTQPAITCTNSDPGIGARSRSAPISAVPAGIRAAR